MSIYEYQFYEYAQKKNVGFVKPDRKYDWAL